jgi:hypothetical protein
VTVGREDRRTVTDRAGGFALVRAAQGFVWTMVSRAGTCWYWRPEAQQWTGRLCGCRSPEQATAGLDPGAPQAEGRFRHHEPIRAPPVAIRKE